MKKTRLFSSNSKHKKCILFFLLLLLFISTESIHKQQVTAALEIVVTPSESDDTSDKDQPASKPPLSGLKKIDGKYYYFTKDGTAYTDGLKKIKSKGKTYYYFFTKNGCALTNKWKTVNGNKYYFGKDGRALTGSNVTISHYYCQFSNKGVLLRRIDKNKPMVALTYDDGPSIYTPGILDTLEKHHAAATFFIVGNRADTYASYIKREKKLGCDIGNHTYDHKFLTRCNASTITSQYTQTNTRIKQIIGETPVLFRPPGGMHSKTVRSTVQMPFILWSVDPQDWRYRNSRTVQSNVLNHVKDGDIILMHDLYKSTADASTVIIPTLINRGYQLVTVNELSACRGSKLKKGTLYYSFRK